MSIREITARVKEMKQRGENVYNFTIGDVGIPFTKAFPILSDNIHAMQTAALSESGNPFGYVIYSGPEEPEEAVADFMGKTYGVKMPPEGVMITNGGSEAIKLCITALDCDIIMPVPTFPQAFGNPESAGNKTIRVDLNDTFHLDNDRIKHILNSDGKRKAVYLPNPSNPTGVSLHDDEMIRLVKNLDETGSYLIMDGAYDLMVWNGGKVAADYIKEYNKILFLGTLSKNWGLPRLRAGWVQAHPEDDDKKDIIGKINKLKFNNTASICPNLAYNFLPGLLSIDEKTMKEYHSEFEERVDLAVEALGDLVEKPDATFYIWMKTVGDDEKFAMNILSDYKIAVVPGSTFGKEGYMRLSLGAISNEDIKESLPMLRECYNDMI